MGKIEYAKNALDSFLKLLIAEGAEAVKLNQLADIEIIHTAFPLVTFCQLIFVTVQRGSKSHFKSLLKQFEAEISFDGFIKEVRGINLNFSLFMIILDPNILKWDRKNPSILYR